MCTAQNKTKPTNFLFFIFLPNYIKGTRETGNQYVLNVLKIFNTVKILFVIYICRLVPKSIASFSILTIMYAQKWEDDSNSHTLYDGLRSKYQLTQKLV